MRLPPSLHWHQLPHVRPRAAIPTFSPGATTTPRPNPFSHPGKIFERPNCTACPIAGYAKRMYRKSMVAFRSNGRSRVVEDRREVEGDGDGRWKPLRNTPGWGSGWGGQGDRQTDKQHRQQHPEKPRPGRTPGHGLVPARRPYEMKVFFVCWLALALALKLIWICRCDFVSRWCGRGARPGGCQRSVGPGN